MEDNVWKFFKEGEFTLTLFAPDEDGTTQIRSEGINYEVWHSVRSDQAVQWAKQELWCLNHCNKVEGRV